jgi:HPt (histidine-containing phosphotransfer) domain-containing protein
MDFSYIEHQTFGDRRLEAELLDLFLSQARDVLPDFLTGNPQAQDEAAHLLKGSALATGASRVAQAAQAFADTPHDARHQTGAAYEELAAAVEEAAQAIIRRINDMRPENQSTQIAGGI